MIRGGDMTNKEIEEMAGHRQVPPWVMMLVLNCIEKEREACAQICDGDGVRQMNGDECAAAIRARGEE